MEGNDWNLLRPPPPGGLSRLQARLDREAQKDRRETLGLGVLTAVLAVALIVFTIPRSNRRPAPKQNFDTSRFRVNGKAVELTGATAHVHYYWVFTDEE